MLIKCANTFGWKGRKREPYSQILHGFIGYSYRGAIFLPAVSSLAQASLALGRFPAARLPMPLAHVSGAIVRL